MAELLLETEFVRLERLDADTFLYVRGERPYPSPDAVVSDFRAVHAKFAEFGTGRRGLLVDLRAATGRNDPEFESAHGAERAKLMHAFKRVALLVRSQVGKLQVTRLAQGDGGEYKVFYDQAEALEWLAS